MSTTRITNAALALAVQIMETRTRIATIHVLSPMGSVFGESVSTIRYKKAFKM